MKESMNIKELAERLVELANKFETMDCYICVALLKYIEELEATYRIKYDESPAWDEHMRIRMNAGIDVLASIRRRIGECLGRQGY